jgi:hypothetical protein
MYYKKMSFLIITLFAFTFLFFFNGCDTAETVDGNVTLSFSTVSGLNKLTTDSLALDTVKILLRDVKLKSESMDDDDDDDNENDSTNHHEGHDEDGNEHSIKVDPFVVHLNLNGMTTDFAVANIPAGTYEKVKFKIHKVGGSETPPDPEFKEGDDESQRYSVIVKGSYNSAPFVYKSKKSAKQQLKLEPPLVVEENTIVNLTITIDPFSWFYEDGNLMDPNNPENNEEIDNNIKDSFKNCYKDDDRDGDED